MSLEQWSSRIVIARLPDEPSCAEDLTALDAVADRSDIILDLTGVGHIVSSTLARFLNLRKLTQANDGRLIVCCVPNGLWGVFLVTGLDKLFEFSDSVTTALATLQMRAGTTG